MSRGSFLRNFLGNLLGSVWERRCNEEIVWTIYMPPCFVKAGPRLKIPPSRPGTLKEACVRAGKRDARRREGKRTGLLTRRTDQIATYILLLERRHIIRTDRTNGATAKLRYRRQAGFPEQGRFHIVPPWPASRPCTIAAMGNTPHAAALGQAHQYHETPQTLPRAAGTKAQPGP